MIYGLRIIIYVVTNFSFYIMTGCTLIPLHVFDENTASINHTLYAHKVFGEVILMHDSDLGGEDRG